MKEADSEETINMDKIVANPLRGKKGNTTRIETIGIMRATMYFKVII